MKTTVHDRYGEGIDGAILRTLALLSYPRILIISRKFLRLLCGLITVSFIYMTLGSIHHFSLQSTNFLYYVAETVLSLYVVLSIYYSILFFYHYRRIRHYTRKFWYRTLFRACTMQIGKVLCALVAIVFLLTLSTATTYI